MLPDMDGSPSPMAFSLDELTWLKASEILDVPPTPPPKDDDVFMQDLSISIRENSLFSTSSIHSGYTVIPPTPTTPESPSRSLSSPKRRSNTQTTSPRSSPRPGDSPRSEWIYRRPKSPVALRSSSTTSPSTSPHQRPRPRPSTGYQTPTVSSLSRNVSGTSTGRTHSTTPAKSFDSADTSMSSASSSTGPFWSTILRPRSRSERSMPLLKTIPSQSQLSLTRPDLLEPSSSTPKRSISSPKAISRRPPSVSSTLSSVSVPSPSPSPSSSRSESPITPISLSSSPYGTEAASLLNQRQASYHRHNNHRRHRTTPSVEGDSLISSSCPPPSKSILTRTASVSTKDSSHTVNKSVKFAAVPIIHYASTGYWDVEAVEGLDDSAMGINVDAMDLDEDPFTNYGARHHAHIQQRSQEREVLVHRLDAAKLRELQCTTPTPERERERAKGLKRLMSLNRKPTATSTSAASPPKPSSSPVSSISPPSTSRATSARPLISTPYALGAHPTPAMQSTTSLRATSQRARKYPEGPPKASHSNNAAGSVPDLLLEGGSHPLRSAPSMESFRSSKSAAARSVRSLSGSVKSTSSTRGVRSWFERTIGWPEP